MKFVSIHLLAGVAGAGCALVLMGCSASFWGAPSVGSAGSNTNTVVTEVKLEPDTKEMKEFRKRVEDAITACDTNTLIKLIEEKTNIVNHVRYTGSRRGQHILDHWESCMPHFLKVFPTEYKRALGRLSREDEAVEREEVLRD